MEINEETLEDKANKPEFNDGDIIQVVYSDGDHSIFICRGTVTDELEKKYRDMCIYDMRAGKIRIDSIFDPVAGYSRPRTRYGGKIDKIVDGEVNYRGLKPTAFTADVKTL